jgi:hypothetical protein
LVASAAGGYYYLFILVPWEEQQQRLEEIKIFVNATELKEIPIALHEETDGNIVSIDNTTKLKEIPIALHEETDGNTVSIDNTTKLKEMSDTSHEETDGNIVSIDNLHHRNAFHLNPSEIEYLRQQDPGLLKRLNLKESNDESSHIESLTGIPVVLHKETDAQEYSVQSNDEFASSIELKKTSTKLCQETDLHIVPSNDEFVSSTEVTAWGFTTYQKLKLFLEKHQNRLLMTLKIVISTYQIVSVAFISSANSMPDFYSKLMQCLDVFNLNFVSVLPMNCTKENRSSYVESLYISALSPIALSGLIFLAFLFAYVNEIRKILLQGTNKKSEMSKRFHDLRSEYLVYFFYLMLVIFVNLICCINYICPFLIFLRFFVLPSVTTNLFKLFVCTNVDIYKEDSSSEDYYLTVDMTMSCSSPEYYRGVYFAIVMILIYPVGIPLFASSMLYQHRKDIKNRDEFKHNSADISHQLPNQSDIMVTTPVEIANEQSTTNNILSPQVMRTAFLWEAYNPRYWYWEGIETTRRLILTAVISVCDPGTVKQSLLALLITLAYAKLYSYCNPYKSNYDNTLAEIGLYQIFLTFFGVMIVANNFLGAQYNISVFVLIVLVNVFIVFYIAKTEYHRYKFSKFKSK